MKKTTLAIVCIFMLVTVSPALAGDCNSDRIVGRWRKERDKAAIQVVQKWASGTPVEDLGSDIAVIFSDEIYILSKCREQIDFLKSNVYVINGNDPTVETVPGIILERCVLGYDILSPWRQFPQQN